MKVKVTIVVLILACLGLGIGLLVRHNRAVEQQQRDAASIQQLSDQWKKAELDLGQQREENSKLANDLQSKSQQLERTTETLEQTKGTLTKTESEVKDTKDQLELTKAEVAKRDARITELENANSALDKQAGELRTAITDREAQIADTQKKLAASEGDREFLLKELRRLQAEKAELERQFNDLVVLKEQVRKLKDELAIQRRLDWIRRGLLNSDKKGAERLQQGAKTVPAAATTNADLNVEVHRDGTPPTVQPGGDKK